MYITPLMLSLTRDGAGRCEQWNDQAQTPPPEKSLSRSGPVCRAPVAFPPHAFGDTRTANINQFCSVILRGVLDRPLSQRPLQSLVSEASEAYVHSGCVCSPVRRQRICRFEYLRPLCEYTLGTRHSILERNTGTFLASCLGRVDHHQMVI